MSDVTYGYFEHDADIGVAGRGPTLESAFEQAALAMFAIMAGETNAPATAAPEAVAVVFEEEDPEIALVTWLNELLTAAQARGLLLTSFRLSRTGPAWQGEGRGFLWPPEAEPGVEVKGATLTMLSVRQAGEGWEARCVVDV